MHQTHNTQTLSERYNNVFAAPHSNLSFSSGNPTFLVRGDGAHVWDSDGNQECVNRYNGDWYMNDVGTSITFDSEGNFIVTGHAFNGLGLGEFDITTLKYDINCTNLWEVRYNGPPSQGDYAVKIIADSEDNLVVCGYSRSGYSHRDYIVLKYDPDVQMLWSTRYNGPNYMEDYS